MAQPQQLPTERALVAFGQRNVMKMARLIPMLPVKSMPASVEFYQKLEFTVERRMTCVRFQVARVRYSDLSDAISIAKRYFTSDLTNRW